MSADWLFEKEEYTPEKEYHRFLDKSIIALLGVLSKIKRRGAHSYKFLYRLNPTLKVIFTFLNITLLSMSRSFIFTILFAVYGILLILTLDNEERKNIFIISITIPIFTFVMLIPSYLSGNTLNSTLILIKVLGNIIFVNILSYTTKWDHITKALKLLFIPDLFIWVMEITIKYIVLLGEYSIEMLYALKLRSIGVNNKKYNSLSKIMGNLFLKSKDMGEEMFSAMECRGFTGEYATPLKFKITRNDYIYIFINLTIIIGRLLISN